MFTSRYRRGGLRHGRGAGLRLLGLEFRLAPATFTVTSTADSGPGSLRQTINNANAAGGADSITFDPATFTSASTITLTSGPIVIRDWTDIFGPAAGLTIDGDKASRIFDLTATINQPVSLTAVNLVNGFAATEGGGAIINRGVTLILTDVIISNCKAVNNGGAIRGGRLLATNCTFGNNSAATGGAVGDVANTTLTDCFLSHNTATNGGGGIFGGNMILDGCTIASNTSTTGGGGVDGGTIRAYNCTFSNNTGSHGGAYRKTSFTTDSTIFRSCTLAFNTATVAGGAIYGGSGTGTLSSCAIANNTAPTGPDINAKMIADYCLVSNASGATSTGSNYIAGVDPLLMPLADNGGPTPTHAFAVGSRLVDSGSNPNSFPTDQRGLPRTLGLAPDIGALEEPGNLPRFSPINLVTPTLGSIDYSFTVTYFDNQGIDVSSLGTGDLTMTGPNGYVAVPTLIAVDEPTNGMLRTATYRISAPGGSWDIADDGNYSLQVNAGQIFDIDTPTANSIPPVEAANIVWQFPRTYLVDLAVDEDDGDYAAGDLSLREAIGLANDIAGTADTITFSPSVFGGAATIAMTGGEFSLTDPLRIFGPTSNLTLNAQGKSRVFNVDVPGKSMQTFVFERLTLVNGKTSGNGGGLSIGDESVQLDNVRVANCEAGRGGAVADSSGAATLVTQNSEFANNKAINFYGSGGAIYSNGSGTGLISLARCTFNSNSAVESGGALFRDGEGTLVVIDCTFSRNAADAGGTPSNNGGGAIYLNGGDAVIRQSTISGNMSNYGGGLYVRGGATVTLQNATIAGNSAARGGGLARFSSAVVGLESTIVADNVALLGPNLLGEYQGNRNLIGALDGNGSITGANNHLNTDPVLSPPGTYGGPTLTYALHGSSPAVDAGSNPAALSNDQRGIGFPRVVGAAPDIGATEGVISAPAVRLLNTVQPAFGATEAIITLTFFDDQGIDVSTLGTGDVIVTGPNGLNATPTFIDVTPATNGSPRAARYRLLAPGGSWDAADSGVYVAAMAANQVYDVDAPASQAVAAGVIVTMPWFFSQSVVVDLPVDENDGNYAVGDLSLREAIFITDNGPAAGNIFFDPVTFAQPTSIVLTNGELSIRGAVTITGPAAELRIDGNLASRVFYVDVPLKSEQPINLVGLTVIKGTGTWGGGIDNYGEALTLSRVTIRNCSAKYSGGGIYVAGTGASLNVNDCTIIDNFANEKGGGLCIDGNFKTTLTRSTIADNISRQNGGGVYVRGTLIADDCTIKGNVVDAGHPYGGGGIFFDSAPATLRNCTITGNSSYYGGAIFNGGTLFGVVTLQNCTVAFNTAVSTGGGLYHGAGKITFTSSVVAKNVAVTGPDLFGSFTANNSLILNTNSGSITGSANLIGVDPQLLPLAANGGPTLTLALPRASPAVNAGSNPANIATDQRGTGFPRASGGAIDIGAYEYQFAPTAAVHVNDGSNQRSMITSLKVTYTEPVTFRPDLHKAVALNRSGPGGPTGSVPLTFMQSGNSLAITFNDPVFAPVGGALIDGNYTLTLYATKIIGAGGPLDGNNDGIAGDDYLFSFHRLFGDADGDRDVDVNDFAAFRMAFGGSSSIFDFDNDGDVDTSDFGQFRTRFGVSM